MSYLMPVASGTEAIKRICCTCMSRRTLIVALIAASLATGSLDDGTPLSSATAWADEAAESSAQPATALARRPRGRNVRVPYRPSDMVRISAGPFLMGLSDEEKVEYHRACMAELDKSNYICQEDWFGVLSLSERDVECFVAPACTHCEGVLKPEGLIAVGGS